MTAKEKEKLVELCERAMDDQDPNRMTALVAEIDRLLEAEGAGSEDFESCVSEASLKVFCRRIL